MKNKEIVLITGSSGFIGSTLAKQLCKNYQVIGVDRDIPKEKIAGVLYHTIDITSHDDVTRTLEEIRQEHGSYLHSVVHLVAYYSFSGEEDSKYQTITVDGTDSLLTELKKHFSVEQFLFSSTMLVYDQVSPGNKIKDDSPLHPTWPYPKSKVETEKLLLNKHADIPIVNLRLAGVYNDFCHSPTISSQIIRIHEGWMTSFPFPGDASHGQTFIHLDDLVTAVERLIEKRKTLSGFENFVLGEEEVMSYRDLQFQIGDLLHERKWPVIRVPKFIALSGAAVMAHLPFIREPFIKTWMIPHADEHFDVDITKFKQKLNWQPQRKLSETLPIMIENLKRDPEKWYAINKIEKPFYRKLNMIGTHREKNQWLATVFTLFLGILLFSNPFTFGNLEKGEFWSQMISGLGVTLLASLALFPTLRWLRWVNALIGSWVMFSPLIFDTASAAAYSNDTLIGGLIMLASVYSPSSLSTANDKGIPPGWTYNPSTAGQRLPIMFLAFMGFILSRYLAAYQLGHIDQVWDPFFGNGTADVLTSSVSQAFPVSDAGLGALTYLLDVIAAAIGGKQRWRTMPWAVIMFGFMIIPAGVTSIVLIMLQPISVGAWCSVCLMTAFVMLIMVPPAVDEVLASVQFLIRTKQQGKPFWRVFWLGSLEGETEQKVANIKPKGSLLHLTASALIGIWLMFAPEVLQLEGTAANNIYIVAALITTFAVIAFSEVARIARLINVPLGLWLAISPWMLGSMEPLSQWHSVLMGVMVILLSLPLGKRGQRFGSSDRFIHWTPLGV